MAKINFKLARKKVQFETEESALNDVLQKNQIEASSLKPEHKEKMWYWLNITDPAEKTTDDDTTFTVEKTPELTLQLAKKQAMEYFKTFEGNIKIVDQDETHFVFSKIRG